MVMVLSSGYLISHFVVFVLSGGELASHLYAFVSSAYNLVPLSSHVRPEKKKGCSKFN